jgi:hypothetical protein
MPAFILALFMAAALHAGHPAKRHHVHHHRRHRHRIVFRVRGRTSVFGALTGDSSSGTTADGGSTDRPCIALRTDAYMDRWFRVTVAGHTARLLHCDYGPAAWTGRSIDITGRGALALGFSPTHYPTGAWGTATLVK